jgi:hypothetical protein
VQRGEVLQTFLAQRDAKILWVPDRDFSKRVPRHLRPAFEQGRLLILTPFDRGKHSRPTRESCSIRNRFVLLWTPRHYFPHIASGSSLAADLNQL